MSTIALFLFCMMPNRLREAIGLALFSETLSTGKWQLYGPVHPMAIPLVYIGAFSLPASIRKERLHIVLAKSVEP